jgi:lysozyme family protein
MASWDFAIARTLPLEGGYVVDHAGPTHRGILLRELRLMGLAADYDGDGDVDADDLRAMPLPAAIAWYQARVWQPGRYELILGQWTAWKPFDTAVNMGFGASSRIAQRAMNRLGADLLVDGFIGPKTREAINQAPEPLVLSAMREEQRKVYDLIINRDPATFARYKTGWYRRAAA